MFERLSTEISILTANIEAKMSPYVSNTSNTTVFLNSSKNSTENPVVPVSPKEQKDLYPLPPPVLMSRPPKSSPQNIFISKTIFRLNPFAFGVLSDRHR
ncbi:hypothetical protein ACTXT7_009443 [Hymenolepis weldensis]